MGNMSTGICNRLRFWRRSIGLKWVPTFTQMSKAFLYHENLYLFSRHKILFSFFNIIPYIVVCFQILFALYC